MILNLICRVGVRGRSRPSISLAFPLAILVIASRPRWPNWSTISSRERPGAVLVRVVGLERYAGQADLPSPMPVAAAIATPTSRPFAYHDFGPISLSFENGNIWLYGFRVSGQLTWELVNSRYLAELPGLGSSWI